MPTTQGSIIRPRLACLMGALLLCLASVSPAQAKRGPSKTLLKGALDKLKPLGAGQYRLSHRLGTVGAGQFAAIGVHVHRGTDCRKHDGVSFPCTWVTPFLMVYDGSGKTAWFSKMATTKPAHSEFKWGVAKLKDVDGDGRKELVVIFGYVHNPVTVYEREHHREIAWYGFNVPSKPRRQGSLLLGYHMGDPNDGTAIKTTFRYVKTAGVHSDLKVKTLETGGDQDVVTNVVLPYDAKNDSWPTRTL